MSVNDSGGVRRSRWSTLPWTRFAIAIALGYSVLSPAAAMASSHGRCVITVDGRPLEAASDSTRAISLKPDAVVRIEGRSTLPITRYTVGIALDQFVVPVYSNPSPVSGVTWSDEISVDEYTRLGAGVLEIVVATNVCVVRGWIVVQRASPFETPAGWLSVGAMSLGALVVLSGFIRGLVGRRPSTAGPRGRKASGFPLRGVTRSFVGGALAGAGFLLFRQQMGASAITAESLLTWTLGPGAVSGVSQAIIDVAASAIRRATSGAPPITSRAEPTSTSSRTPAHPPVPRVPVRPAEDTAWSGPLPSAGTAATDTDGAAAPPSARPSAPRVHDTGGTAAGAARVEAAAPEDPPRTTYARLECPDAVVAHREFELIVGLTDSPDRRLFSEPLQRPAWSVGPYTMTIQIVADGFSLREGESWRLDLPVTARRPYPVSALHLTPTASGAPIRAASIRAMYSVGGQPIGLAIRSVAVVRDASLLRDAPQPEATPGVDLTVPEGQTAPDLTVRIEYAESQGGGRLLMQLLTAVPNISVPDAPIGIDIGGDPAADLRRVINTMNLVEGTPTQFVSLRGIGLTIAEQLPREFWNVLADVKSRVGDRAPTILFLSAEPYVPWELAVVDPPLDPLAPPFLSAQANVGRWVLGQRRPKLPPPAAQSLGSMAVVSGTYDLPGWARLVEAEAEAADLVRTFGATTVDATTVMVLELLRRDPSTDVIHFAVHGNFDAEGIEDGLILVDGKALDPLAVRGTSISGSPFLFLNACQVGRGRQILGDHAGLAAAFLFAGASGVIAPLWSVDDRVARAIALRFYEGALAGETAADILRRERAGFRDSPDTVSSTYLAYQYFGHPALRLQRSPSGADLGTAGTVRGTGTTRAPAGAVS